MHLCKATGPFFFSAVTAETNVTDKACSGPGEGGRERVGSHQAAKFEDASFSLCFGPLSTLKPKILVVP